MTSLRDRIMTRYRHPGLMDPPRSDRDCFDFAPVPKELLTTMVEEEALRMFGTRPPLTAALPAEKGAAEGRAAMNVDEAAYYILSKDLYDKLPDLKPMPSPVGGRMIDGPTMKAIIDKIVITAINDSGYEGIHVISGHLQGETPVLHEGVRITSWNGANQRGVKNLVDEIFCKDLGFKGVVLSVPHGSTEMPALAGFHIHIWSSPNGPEDEGDESNINPWDGELWGFGDYCHDPADLNRWDEGIPIVSPEGLEVGACDAHNLYIYYDAVTGHENELEILREVFEAAANILRGGVGTVGTAEIRPAPTDRERYIQFCAARPKISRRNARKEMEQAQQYIENYRRGLVEQVRRRDEASRVLTAPKKDDDAKHAELSGLEYDKLVAHPKLKNVSVRGGSLVCKTKMIFITHPRTKKVYEIGEFEINIGVRHGEITLKNLTRQVDSFDMRMHHPHVFPAGNACWGNIDNAVWQYAAAHEYSALISIILAFLESVDTNDNAGQGLGRWPLAEVQPERPKRKRPSRSKAAIAARAAEKARKEAEGAA